MVTPSITVVMPVFNDWKSAHKLVGEIDSVFRGSDHTLHIIAVDDSSTEPYEDAVLLHTTNVERVTRLNLVGNVGHQRAIVIGLAWAEANCGSSLTAVMDSDGEDTPEELKRLVERAESDSDKVVVAQRAQRSEGFAFRLFYQFYRFFFSGLTGHRINFGNFMVVPSRWRKRVLSDPNIWNNVAATMVRSRLPIAYLPTKRGHRYFGRSKMNFVSLVEHGLGAISVFAVSAFIRISVASVLLGMVSLIAAAAATWIRLNTDMHIPGWTTSMVGITLLISVQAFFIPVMMAFVLLSNRSAGQSLPKEHALAWIDSSDEILVDPHQNPHLKMLIERA
ncbi:MAG: glycosyltransferase [Pseudomonadota bacterium]